MAGNRERSRIQSKTISLCGMTAALSVALMLLGGTIPIATYCVPMMGGILLLPILLEFGKKEAWTVYGAVSFLVLTLGIDKEAALFYIFLGHYPLVKWQIDRVKPKQLRLLLKLLLFNAALLLMYTILGALLNMDVIVEEFRQMGPALLTVFGVMLNICLLLYDRLLLPLVYLYTNRIRPRFRFLQR